MTNTETLLIGSFTGVYRFLSNFWPCNIEYEGLLHPTTEHAYQAAKTDLASVKKEIQACPTPKEAKAYLEDKKNLISESWTDEKRILVMEEILMKKFGGESPLLTRALLATGDLELIEGNYWNDTFFGVYEGKGKNHLGKLLMKIRAHLRKEKEIIFQQKILQQGNRSRMAREMNISERMLYQKLVAFEVQ